MEPILNSNSAITWNLLQISDVLDLELASALAESVSILAWEPEHSFFPFGDNKHHEVERQHIADSSNAKVRIRKFPMLKGYARWPLSLLARTGPSVLKRLLRQTPDPERSPLICTTPYFAPVAELWPGPVIYWLTDLIAEYASADKQTVIRLDQRLCEVATLVCPNSRRLAAYLTSEGHCDASKIQMIPNATRASNLLRNPRNEPISLPKPDHGVLRPFAGVIGNLAGNMDWLLLQDVIEKTPWLSWVFVGPTSMTMKDRSARLARTAVMAHSRTYFVGKQPYGALASYARSFDVAILPYKRCEPTYSGSSTRFYEHLAACRPMIATQGLEELVHKVPLITLTQNAEEMVSALLHLKSNHFDDGLTLERWKASQQATWQVRAHAIIKALEDRTGQQYSAPHASTHSSFDLASR